MSATGNLHRRRGRQNKVGHNTSVLEWTSGFGKCTQNRRSRTSGEFGGLSRYDPQPPRHRQTVQSTVSRRFGFVNESWESENSQFSFWNRWLTAHDISWRTRMSRVNPNKGGRGRQRDVQRNRSSSGRAGQTPTERAAGPNVARWRRLSSQPSRRAAVSSLALLTLTSSHRLVQSHLPMWSSLRRPWPSSSYVRRGWRAWETERRVGVRRRTGKQGDASRRT